MKNLERRMEQQIAENNQKFADLISMIKEIKEDSRTDRDTNQNSQGNPTTGTSSAGNFTKTTLGYAPKLEFPKFDGTNPRLWIKKCCKYFSLCKISEDQKVDLASLNMIDQAEHWISSYLSIRKNVDWSDFVIELNARFKDSTANNVVEQFNKLQQGESLESYIDEFEHLRSIMIQNNSILPDSYVLESFIGGLKPAVKPFVKAFKL